MKAKDAIDFHSQCVAHFAAHYRKDRDFHERYSVWTKLIEKYSSPAASVLDAGCGVGMLSFSAAAIPETGAVDREGRRRGCGAQG